MQAGHPHPSCTLGQAACLRERARQAICLLPDGRKLGKLAIPALPPTRTCGRPGRGSTLADQGQGCGRQGSHCTRALGSHGLLSRPRRGRPASRKHCSLGRRAPAAAAAAAACGAAQRPAAEGTPEIGAPVHGAAGQATRGRPLKRHCRGDRPRGSHACPALATQLALAWLHRLPCLPSLLRPLELGGIRLCPHDGAAAAATAASFEAAADAGALPCRQRRRRSRLTLRRRRGKARGLQRRPGNGTRPQRRPRHTARPQRRPGRACCPARNPDTGAPLQPGAKPSPDPDGRAAEWAEVRGKPAAPDANMGSTTDCCSLLPCCSFDPLGCQG